MSLSTELRFAFYTAAFTFIWLMLEYLAGLHDRYVQYHPVVTMFAVFIPVVFFFLGMRRKRDVDYDGVMSWQRLLRTGLIITVCTASMIVPLQIAFHYFINPRFFDVMISYAVERAAANNKDVTVARQEAMATFNVKSYVMQSAVSMLVLGTLLSVIYSFVLRRRDFAQPDVIPEPAPPQSGP